MAPQRPSTSVGRGCSFQYCIVVAVVGVLWLIWQHHPWLEPRRDAHFDQRKPHSATMSTAEERLWRWMESLGGDLEAIEVSPATEDGPRGLSAKRDLHAGDIAFSIPKRATILSTNISKHGLTQMARTHSKAPAQWLIASLLLESAATRERQWWPYVSMLPEIYDELPSWWFAFSDMFPQTLGSIASGSVELRAMVSSLTKWADELRTAHGLMMDTYADHPNARVRAAACSPRLFTRAIEHVRSRSIDVEMAALPGTHDSKSLAPVFELVNHPNSLDNVNFELQDGGEVWLARITAERVAMGAELHRAYSSGRKREDAELFFTSWGFIPPYLMRTLPKALQAELGSLHRLAQEEAASAASQLMTLEVAGAGVPGWPTPREYCKGAVDEVARADAAAAAEKGRRRGKRSSRKSKKPPPLENKQEP